MLAATYLTSHTPASAPQHASATTRRQGYNGTSPGMTVLVIISSILFLVVGVALCVLPSALSPSIEDVATLRIVDAIVQNNVHV